MNNITASRATVRGDLAAILLFAVVSLLALGVVMLFSTSSVSAGELYGDSSFFLKRQLVYLGIGLLLCGIGALVDYNFWRQNANLLLGVALLLLILCFVPHIGLKINGARRWIGSQGIRCQPSDLSKFALVVFIACWLDRYQRKIKTFVTGFLVPTAVMGITIGLIFIEPDFGTTALIALVVISLMFVAGSRWRYLLPMIIAGCAIFAFAVLRNPVRMQRILAFMDPQGTAQGAGYQTLQSLLALGSGGVFGRGLGNSAAKFYYLPEARTDFILAIVGEELGLVGSLIVLAAFATIVICGIRIALRAPEAYGSFLAFGLTALIGFQALINIGVVTGTLPNKGLPLPFISFGGSNLVMNLLGIGVLINIARHSQSVQSTVDNTGLQQKHYEMNALTTMMGHSMRYIP